MLVFPAAELAAIVAEYRVDLGVMCLEAGQHIIVEEMSRCDGAL